MKMIKIRSKMAKYLKAFFVAMIAASMIVAAALPQEVDAATSQKGTNSAVLDSLLSDRAFVVQCLMTGVRPESQWGGKGFNNNPHMNVGGYVDHFMYEDLLQEYTTHPVLSAIVSLYTAKSQLENYPLETLMAACESTSSFGPFIFALRTANDAANNAVKQAYEDMGGKYPIQETLNAIAADPDTWNGYSLTRLKSMVEGSEEYKEYKKELEASNDSLDNALYDLLTQKEEECYNSEYLKALRNTIRSMQGVENQSASESLKTTKIYDIILNDIFSSDYTSAAGISLSRDLTSKVEYDQWMDVLGNYSDAYGYISDVVDLSSSNAKKAMIDDYLDILSETGTSKRNNLYAALGVMEGSNESWFETDNSPLTGEVMAFYNFMGEGDTEEERILSGVKEQCDTRFFTRSQTADYLSTVGKAFKLSKKTLANYWLVDTLLRENDTIRGVLNRVAGQTSGANDTGFTNAVYKYRKLLDYNDGDANTEILLSVLNTAASELNSTLEKSVSKAVKSEVRKALVSLGRGPVSRAKIAMTASKISNIYNVVDILDDYVAGLQDVAEKIYEIKYLQTLAGYAAESYNKDVQSYQEESDPARAEKYAANAIDDLQFLRQIKMRQNKDAFDALSGIQDNTLSGIIAKIITHDDGSTLAGQYQKQMNAFTQMQVFPVSNTPFEIKSGQTLTITEEYYNSSRTTYVGTIRKDDEVIGKIAEMDLYIAGGVRVAGNLVIDCNVRIPQIIGDGGTVTVKNGVNPTIGYVDGSIRAGSNLHIKGSVNGEIYNADTNNRVTITVDGSLSTSSLSANNMVFNIKKYLDAYSVDLTSANVTVAGNANIDQNFRSNSSTMKVNGNCSISKVNDSYYGSYLGLKNSTLEVLGDFGYYGIGGYNSNVSYNNRLTDDSQLILHGVSTFESYDKKPFSVYNDSDTGIGSGIVLAGNGTARLVTTIYEDAYEYTYGTYTTYYDYPSVRFGENCESGELLFATNSISGFENLYGDVKFPAGMNIIDDSTIFKADLMSDGQITFRGNLRDTLFKEEVSDTASNDFSCPVRIMKDLTVNKSNTLEVWNELTVDGSVKVNGYFQGNSTVEIPGILNGNMIVNAGGQLKSSKRSVSKHCTFHGDGAVSGSPSLDYTAEDRAFGENKTTYGFTIDGDLTAKADSELYIDSLYVKGNMTTEEDALTGAYYLRVGEYLDIKGNINYEHDLGIVHLTLEKSADLKGLSTAGLWEISTLDFAGSEDEVHEIRLNENVQIRDFYCDKAIVSLPGGIMFDRMNIGDTLTVRGVVPYFEGDTQHTGSIVFEDNVKRFTMTGTVNGNYSTLNGINNIHARKDFRLFGTFVVRDPENEGDPAGQLSVDGDLTFGYGSDVTFYCRKYDFGSARIVLDQNASLMFWSEEITAGGLFMQYDTASMQFNPPFSATDDLVTHMIINNGDYVVNENVNGAGWLTLNSGDSQLISSRGERYFTMLEVNVPELHLNSKNLITDAFITDTKGLVVKGTCGYLTLGNISSEVRNKAEYIRFESFPLLEELHYYRDDLRRAEYVWDIESIEQSENGYLYTGNLDLRGKTSDDCELYFGCADENDDYAYMILFRKGSLILPYWTGEKLYDQLYTEKECYNRIDLTKTHVSEDMRLYYRGDGFDEIPEDPETIQLDEEKLVEPSARSEVRTFAFTPSEDGNYLYESLGNLEPSGCVAVDDGLYASEYIYTEDNNFAHKFKAKAGTTYYLQSKIYYGDVGPYTVKVTKLEDEPDIPDPGPDEPEPEPDPHLNPIAPEDVESVELGNMRPYVISIADKQDYGRFSVDVRYVMRRGETFTVNKKDGTSVTYTYGDYQLSENTYTTALNDGTDMIDIYSEEVEVLDEEGYPVEWEAGETHQWRVSYSMYPSEARYKGLEDEITCLVDVYVATEEEYELFTAKEDAYRDLKYYILGDYDGYLDDYADEQVQEKYQLYDQAVAAIDKAENAEEARQIYEDAIAADEKILRRYEVEYITANVNSAKENLSNYKDEHLLDELYTPEDKAYILNLIAETELAIDEVAADRDNYSDIYDMCDAIMNLSYDCMDAINAIEVKDFVSELEVKLSPTKFKYNGKVQKPAVKVIADGEVLDASEYRVDWPAGCKNVGDYFVEVTLTGSLRGSNAEYYYIQKASNPMKVKTKTATVKYSAVKKKTQTIKASKLFSVSKAQGKVTYKKSSGNKKITISSAGKVTVKKGLKKGTYKVKVKVTAAGNSNYNKTTKTVTITIKVK